MWFSVGRIRPFRSTNCLRSYSRGIKCRSLGVRREAALGNGRFTEDQSSFTSAFTIRGYEVGPDRHASIVTIANLLQENATNHAVALWGVTDEGFANDPCMIEKGLIWVLTRLQIRMEEYPSWGDEIEIETWVHPEGRAAVSREYLIKNPKNGKLLGCATSLWVSVNTKTRRISRIPDDVKTKCEAYWKPGRASPFLSEESRRKLPEIITNSAISGPVRFAGHMQIDMNNHINNVAYLMWALDLIPDPIFESYYLREVEIDFKAECDVGSRVEGYLMEIKESHDSFHKQFIHNLIIPNESHKSKELIRLRTSWT